LGTGHDRVGWGRRFLTWWSRHLLFFGAAACDTEVASRASVGCIRAVLSATEFERISLLLNMTNDAAKLVRVLAHRGAVASDGGVRIVVNDRTSSLSMSLASSPGYADAVITHDGARVFLSQHAARRMRNKTLCAEVNSRRSLFFLR
jgi:Fe-S cluster assembly iron-binding protein IscA